MGTRWSLRTNFGFLVNKIKIKKTLKLVVSFWSTLCGTLPVSCECATGVIITYISKKVKFRGCFLSFF